MLMRATHETRTEVLPGLNHVIVVVLYLFPAVSQILPAEPTSMAVMK